MGSGTGEVPVAICCDRRCARNRRLARPKIRRGGEGSSLAARYERIAASGPVRLTA